MKSVKRNEVGYSEIFHFAEKKFGVGWNAANNLFWHDGPLNYQRTDDIELGEIEADLENTKIEYPEYKDLIKAYEILIAFMKENNVTEMRVNSDD